SCELALYVATYSHFFFFNATPPPEIYTLSLHDALPISQDSATATRRGRRNRLTSRWCGHAFAVFVRAGALLRRRRVRPSQARRRDRKSTRLNSSHVSISYAVFCLKKKKHNHHDLHYYTH